MATASAEARRVPAGCLVPTNATLPLSFDPAIAERASGPIFITSDEQRLNRHGASRIVRRVTRLAGIA